MMRLKAAIREDRRERERRMIAKRMVNALFHHDPSRHLFVSRVAAQVTDAHQAKGRVVITDTAMEDLIDQIVR